MNWDQAIRAWNDSNYKKIVSNDYLRYIQYKYCTRIYKINTKLNLFLTFLFCLIQTQNLCLQFSNTRSRKIFTSYLFIQYINLYISLKKIRLLKMSFPTFEEKDCWIRCWRIRLHLTNKTLEWLPRVWLKLLPPLPLINRSRLWLSSHAKSEVFTLASLLLSQSNTFRPPIWSQNLLMPSTWSK